MTTIKDISKLAGISTSTVSRVVSKKGFVAEKTRKKILEAIDVLGYQPNSLAQGLKNKRSNMIGVLIADLCAPFFATMLKGVEQKISQFGMSMIVCSGHADKSLEKQAVTSLLRNRCDALILHIESDCFENELEKLIRNTVPVVMIGGSSAVNAKYSVSTDNEYGGYLATRHLIKTGHRKIVHLMGEEKLFDSRERLKGYKRALLEAGIEFRDEYVIKGSFLDKFGYDATLSILDKKLPFSAIFAGDDEIAIGVMEALRNRSINVPEEISVIGFDDMFYARFMNPKLTTVKQKIIEMGEAAGNLAIDILKERKVEQNKIVFAPELIERSSVGFMK